MTAPVDLSALERLAAAATPSDDMALSRYQRGGGMSHLTEEQAKLVRRALYRRERFTLDNGEHAEIEWPETITPADADEMEEWLFLLIKKVRRFGITHPPRGPA